MSRVLHVPEDKTYPLHKGHSAVEIETQKQTFFSSVASVIKQGMVQKVVFCVIRSPARLGAGGSVLVLPPHNRGCQHLQ